MEIVWHDQLSTPKGDVDVNCRTVRDDFSSVIVLRQLPIPVKYARETRFINFREYPLYTPSPDWVELKNNPTFLQSWIGLFYARHVSHLFLLMSFLLRKFSRNTDWRSSAERLFSSNSPGRFWACPNLPVSWLCVECCTQGHASTFISHLLLVCRSWYQCCGLHHARCRSFMAWLDLQHYGASGWCGGLNLLGSTVCLYLG